jgi:nucleotide-binding universal stress UspA family protein
LKRSILKILVCVDGSKYTDKVIARAFSLAERYNSKLYLIYVLEKNTIDFWDNSRYVGITSETLMKRRRNAYKMIEKKMEKFAKQINFQVSVLEGHISNEILKYAKRKSIDLIVLGNRGLGGFKKMFLGSTSINVSEHSHCSVLIVK